MRLVPYPGYDRVDSKYAQRTFFFLMIHVPLGFAMKANPWIATAHALGTVLVAVFVVFNSRTLFKLLPVMSYAVVSESLWRLGKAMVFYELAKYLLVLLSLLALSRVRRKTPFVMTPFFYFLLLIPSIAVMPTFSRGDISFNLSGPLSLAVATVLLGRLPLSQRALRRVLTSIMGPIVALASLASFSTLTTENINFYSSKVASGGLGQNQASSIMGLGALAAFLYLSLLRRQRNLSVLFAFLGVWCATQGALTFSRGGMATTAGAAAAATFFLVLDRRFRGAALIRVLLLATIGFVFIVPVLDSITAGGLTNRFSSVDLTGRDKIISADYLAFREHPILGVGPGQSAAYHLRSFRQSSAHTEYSRLLAEHGILGGAALLLIIVMGVRGVLQQSSARSRAFSAALVTWALLFMFHAAMRMAAVSFIFALASTVLVDDKKRLVPVTPTRSGARLRS